MDSNSFILGQGVSTLTELLGARAAETPDKLAYAFLKDGAGESPITYGELDLRARTVAAQLAGVTRPGDRALLLYPPGIDFLIGFLGSLYARVVAVPLPLPGARTGLEKLELVREDTGARVALTIESLSGERIGKGISLLATDRVPAEDAGVIPEPCKDGDLAYLQYTSGSTSAPRGVMITHRNVLHNLAKIDGVFQHGDSSVAVSWLPHFHDMGLIYGLLEPLYVGMPGYFMSPAAFVQRPRFWLETIMKYGATHSGGPNFAYDLCVRRIPEEERAGLDLSTWEVAFNGAEPVHAETLDRFAAAFAGQGFRREAFHPAYGLAEASLMVTGGEKLAGASIFAADAAALAVNRVAPASDEESARTMVGCGHAGLDTEVVIANPETLEAAAPAEVGEVWVRGPGVAQGYWNRPEETARTFGAKLAGGRGPYLRTGDLGFLRNGELFIAGRSKDLIIIRGLNHHPADLELTARRAHPEIAASIAAAFSIEAGGDERLVLVMEAGRHPTRDPEDVARAVRQAIAERHEVRVYAFVLVRKGTIPKTSSGKIQRRRCRSLYLEGKLDVLYQSLLEDATVDDAPARINRDQLLAADPAQREQLIAGYLRELLGAALKADPGEFDADQPITRYGIDSLMAMELQHRVETDLGIALTAVEMLEGATLAALAGVLRDGLDDELRVAAPIPARHATEAPLSFEQERLWLLDQLAPGNPAYHVPFGFRIRGAIDHGALNHALQLVVRRHETLRSEFVTPNGEPRARALEDSSVSVEVHDLAGSPAAERFDQAIELADREIRAPFDLRTGSLFRFCLYRLSATDHLALIVMHHIVSDLWSIRLFLDELFTAYAAARAGETPALEPLPVQYGDYAAWQRETLRGEKLELLTRYWQEKLRGAPRLEMPTDRPRPATPSFKGGSVSVAFPDDLARTLREFARRRDVTLFTVLLAGFKAFAARCSGQTDLVIGATNANRNRPELERLIGFFAAPLVVRTTLTADPDFDGIVNRVRETLLEAYAHQELPFAKVVEAAQPGRQSSYTPLFQVMFSVVKTLLPASEADGLDLEALELGAGATDFDLFLNVIEERDSLRAVVVYSEDLYGADTVRRLMDAYLELLREALDTPTTKLHQFRVPEDLKRREPAAEVAPSKPPVVVCATYTAEPVREVLEFWWRELGFDYETRFAPYNQVFQQLLDPSSPVRRNREGVNVMLIRLEEWTRLSKPDALERLEESVRNFAATLKSAAAATPAPFLVCLCPPSNEFLSAPKRAAFGLQMESFLASNFADSSTIHLVRSAEALELYPAPEYYDPHGDRIGHIPYTPEYFAALGTLIARKIHAMRTAPYKVIAFDCDQTLWRGVCGEDGPDGVTIDPPRRELQDFAVDQHGAGMLLAIASKNNEEDVWATFDAHPDMPLRREHFVASRINWEPKSENLRELAAELGLGLDSFIFIDDSPTECAEVEAGAPEVLVLQLPKNPDRIPDFLRQIWAFDHLTTTEEDKKRSAMYGQRLERRKLQKKVETLAEFLAALEIKIEIGEMEPDQLPRVSQLTQRTNQFNLTGIRRTETQIQEFLTRGECLTVRVKDRFGSYGLVGVVLFTTNESVLDVDTFLLSCRALGRGVEHRMLARLGEIAGERGLANIRVRSVSTAKNRPALKFIRGVADEFEQPTGDGFLYLISAAHARRTSYNPRGKPGEPITQISPSATPSPESTARSIDYVAVATELSDVSAIIERVRARSRSSATAGVPYEPPRTQLERQLCDIWAEMLNTPRVGVNDNFFDLGGHSLLAVQLLSRVRETFQVDLSLDVVFSGVFSVAELAKAIELYEIEQAGSEEYEALLAELEGLSDEQVRALLEEEEKAQSGDGTAT